MVRLRFRKGLGSWIYTNARDEDDATRVIANLESDGYEVDRY